MDLSDFWNIKDRELTQKEIEFIKSEIPKNKYRAFYAIWRQHRKNGKYIAFIIDNGNGLRRRSAIFKSIEIISERDLTNVEYTEQIKNFGCNSRRFTVWNYDSLFQLQQDESKYGLQVPEKFIKEVKARSIENNVQLGIQF